MYGIQQDYCTFLKHTEEKAAEQLAVILYWKFQLPNTVVALKFMCNWA